MDPVELLHGMVAIESLSGAEGPLAEWLVERMAALGLDAHVDGAGNAVGLKRGADGGGPPRELVLLGHMDTVPGRIPVRIEDGVLHGRGAVDAKGALATFVCAVARAEVQPDATLTVIGAVEEESATSRGARFVAPRPAPQACLIGEPSGWDALTLGYKGRLLCDLAIAQPCGHSAGPRGAVAERAADVWRGMLDFAADFNQGRGRLFERLLPSLRSIRTDSDGLTERVVATLGWRLPPGFDTGVVKERARELGGDDALLRFYGEEPAWSSPRTTPLARAFGRAIRARGGAGRFLHKTGTSDMNVLGPAWGCPIAAYGPGDSLLDHTPQERLDLDEYARAIDVLHGALVELGFSTA